MEWWFLALSSPLGPKTRTHLVWDTSGFLDALDWADRRGQADMTADLSTRPGVIVMLRLFGNVRIEVSGAWYMTTILRCPDREVSDARDTYSIDLLWSVLAMTSTGPMDMDWAPNGPGWVGMIGNNWAVYWPAFEFRKYGRNSAQENKLYCNWINLHHSAQFIWINSLAQLYLIKPNEPE